MKLIYMEPVLEEIEKQQEYFEQAEDFDCAEAVMSAKWAVINAKEIKAIPIEWLREKMTCADDAGDLDSVDLISWLIQTREKENVK